MTVCRFQTSQSGRVCEQTFLGRTAPTSRAVTGKWSYAFVIFVVPSHWLPLPTWSTQLCCQTTTPVTVVIFWCEKKERKRHPRNNICRISCLFQLLSGQYFDLQELSGVLSTPLCKPTLDKTENWRILINIQLRGVPTTRFRPSATKSGRPHGVMSVSLSSPRGVSVTLSRDSIRWSRDWRGRSAFTLSCLDHAFQVTVLRSWKCHSCSLLLCLVFLWIPSCWIAKL